MLTQHAIYGKFFTPSKIEKISKMLVNSTQGISGGGFKCDAGHIKTYIGQQKLHFDTFLFDLDYHNTKLYKIEFLLFDFMVFFLAETHSQNNKSKLRLCM